MHRHHHNHTEAFTRDKNLIIAVAVNVLLTVIQIIGGLISGSLALIADAIHNLSDAAALAIAYFARVISRRPPDAFRTFGYKRAEIIAALINLTILIVIGIYLLYEAIWRLLEPQSIAGWIVIIVAAIALLVDIITAALTFTMAKHSLNIRAAFLHNVADAMSSVGVIIVGTCILLFGWLWIDAVITMLIAGYILYQGFTEIPKTIHILMDGTPGHLSIDEVIAALEDIDGIDNVHHVHIRQLDEHNNALEAHIVSTLGTEQIEQIKILIRSQLNDRFRIEHCTLEFEHPDASCSGNGTYCH